MKSKVQVIRKLKWSSETYGIKYTCQNKYCIPQRTIYLSELFHCSGNEFQPPGVKVIKIVKVNKTPLRNAYTKMHQYQCLFTILCNKVATVQN